MVSALFIIYLLFEMTHEKMSFDSQIWVNASCDMLKGIQNMMTPWIIASNGKQWHLKFKVWILMTWCSCRIPFYRFCQKKKITDDNQWNMYVLSVIKWTRIFKWRSILQSNGLSWIIVLISSRNYCLIDRIIIIGLGVNCLILIFFFHFIVFAFARADFVYFYTNEII